MVLTGQWAADSAEVGGVVMRGRQVGWVRVAGQRMYSDGAGMVGAMGGWAQFNCPSCFARAGWGQWSSSMCLKEAEVDPCSCAGLCKLL